VKKYIRLRQTIIPADTKAGKRIKEKQKEKPISDIIKE